jgi:hypothetical protein
MLTDKAILWIRVHSDIQNGFAQSSVSQLNPDHAETNLPNKSVKKEKSFFRKAVEFISWIVVIVSGIAVLIDLCVKYFTHHKA